jgi:uncharacterized protein YdeI (YjbR/CyaY-like superfamily)
MAAMKFRAGSCCPSAAKGRADSGASAGDGLDVEITVDTEPRTVTVSADLGAALAAEPALHAAWDEFAFTHQREHAEAIEDAKKPETRQRRVEKAIEMVRGRG